uniref:Uncharacterized protein n=1 Tax=Globisporangium ultimum (strain ATCC 200006 / CBS 805.95 / DAOM BR144) TaxID=431595 RepID=K3WH54_GLOUD
MGDNQDDTTDDEDRSKAGRTDIQEEIRKMHRSVRQQRKSQAEALAMFVPLKAKAHEKENDGDE